MSNKIQTMRKAHQKALANGEHEKAADIRKKLMVQAKMEFDKGATLEQVY